MSRGANILRGILVVLAGITAILGSAVFVFGMLNPEFQEQVNLEAVPSGLGTSALSEMLRIDPLLDLGLLVGAYLTVCLLSWIQEELPIYLANRQRFQ